MRILVGMLIAPLIYVLFLCIPALNEPDLGSWILFSSFLAYIYFFFAASITHIILRILKWRKYKHYCCVMFSVTFTADLSYSFWVLRGYESYYYFRTQVIEHGQFTTQGIILQFIEATVYGIVAAIAISVFFAIAFNLGREKSDT